jgi:hypothetical protein
VTGWPPAWLKLPLRGRTGRRGTDCSDGTAESIGQSLNQRRFMHACSVTDMWIHVQTYRTLVGEKKSRHSRDVCYLDWDWIHLTGQIPREFSQRRLSFTDKTLATVVISVMRYCCFLFLCQHQEIIYCPSVHSLPLAGDNIHSMHLDLIMSYPTRLILFDPPENTRPNPSRSLQ